MLHGTCIRRLTPRECLRLQGWQDDRIDQILAVTSEAQAYRQAGNGVTVTVVEAIGRRLAVVDDALQKSSGCCSSTEPAPTRPNL